MKKTNNKKSLLLCCCNFSKTLSKHFYDYKTKKRKKNKSSASIQLANGSRQRQRRVEIERMRKWELENGEIKLPFCIAANGQNCRFDNGRKGGGGMEGKTSLNPDDKMVLKRRGKEKEDEEKEGKGSRLKCVAQRQIAEGWNWIRPQADTMPSGLDMLPWLLGSSAPPHHHQHVLLMHSLFFFFLLWAPTALSQRRTYQNAQARLVRCCCCCYCRCCLKAIEKAAAIWELRVKTEWLAGRQLNSQLWASHAHVVAQCK